MAKFSQAMALRERGGPAGGGSLIALGSRDRGMVGGMYAPMPAPVPSSMSTSMPTPMAYRPDLNNPHTEQAPVPMPSLVPSVPVHAHVSHVSWEGQEQEQYLHQHQRQQQQQQQRELYNAEIPDDLGESESESEEETHKRRQRRGGRDARPGTSPAALTSGLDGRITISTRSGTHGDHSTYSGRGDTSAAACVVSMPESEHPLSTATATTTAAATTTATTTATAAATTTATTTAAATTTATTTATTSAVQSHTPPASKHVLLASRRHPSNAGGVGVVAAAAAAAAADSGGIAADTDDQVITGNSVRSTASFPFPVTSSLASGCL